MLQALDYAHQTAKFHALDYIEVLRSSPNMKFASALFKRKLGGKPLVPLGVVIRVLIEEDAYEVGLNLLHEVHLSGSQGEQCVCKMTLILGFSK